MIFLSAKNDNKGAHTINTRKFPDLCPFGFLTDRRVTAATELYSTFFFLRLPVASSLLSTIWPLSLDRVSQAACRSVPGHMAEPKGI